MKNKLEFVTGEFTKPTPHYQQWKRCDNIVTLLILNSLVKDIADSVEYVNSSVELWKELNDRYDQANEAKLYHIQREINDLYQGTMDITSYYMKIKKLWKKLSNIHLKMQCSCNCACGARENLNKTEQDHRPIQFLIGLNEVYIVIRGNILMMNPPAFLSSGLLPSNIR